MGRRKEIRQAAAAAEEAVVASSRSLRNPANRSIQEQIDFLRGALGRVSRRLASLEAGLRQHGHPQLEAPPLRNGMYIDNHGQYWMKRPDGWHYCYILASIEQRPGGLHDRPEYPVQRLAEPKGEGPLR